MVYATCPPLSSGAHLTYVAVGISLLARSRLPLRRFGVSPRELPICRSTSRTNTPRAPDRRLRRLLSFEPFLHAYTATFLQLQAIQQPTDLHKISLEKFDRPSFPVELHEMMRRSSAELATLRTNLQISLQAFQARLIYILLRQTRRSILPDIFSRPSNLPGRNSCTHSLRTNLQQPLSVEASTLRTPIAAISILFAQNCNSESSSSLRTPCTAPVPNLHF
jgi:hypothetical protein